MSIKVVIKFDSADTVRIIAYIYDDDGALVDPTAITCTVIDPDGTTQADAQAMSGGDTGVYTYYYHRGTGEDAMAKGKWRGKVVTADGTGEDTVYSTGYFSFTVE